MPSRYAIGDHSEPFIRKQVEQEEYRIKIREGVESPSLPADEVFNRLEPKYQAMIDKKA